MENMKFFSKNIVYIRYISEYNINIEFEIEKWILYDILESKKISIKYQ
jgi:hypothetical protein